MKFTMKKLIITINKYYGKGVFSLRFDNVIISDLYRRQGKSSFKDLLKALFMVPQFKIVYFKRKCEYFKHKSRLMYILYRLIYEHYQVKYNTQIPANVKIGNGFAIGHYGGIVINPDAIIGKNVNIFNGVLVGTEFRGKRQGVPVIGDRVWIGTNAVIVGNIKIGNNVLIAPNSYVNFDVPDNSIVVGNPAKVISNEKATYKYIDHTVE